MGMDSYFIKAIGDCRIMVKPFRQAVERNRKETGKIYPIDAYNLTLLETNIDENGEEFYTLKQFGEVINNRKFYGYLGEDLCKCLFSIYECMSIDHACCYKVDMNSSKNMETTTQLITRKKGILQLDEVKKCRNLDELKKLFKSYSIVKSGFIIGKEELSDIKIVTQRECIEFDEFPIKSKKYNTEPCKLYFSTDDLDFGYLEFLPFGKGIVLAATAPFVWRRFMLRGNDLEFLCNVKDELFNWGIIVIEMGGKNYVDYVE